jgi:hypothetical protein
LSTPPIWPFPKDSATPQVTYKRLLALLERINRIENEADDLRRDILTWMRIDADERAAQK